MLLMTCKVRHTNGMCRKAGACSTLGKCSHMQQCVIDPLIMQTTMHAGRPAAAQAPP